MHLDTNKWPCLSFIYSLLLAWPIQIENSYLLICRFFFLLKRYRYSVKQTLTPKQKDWTVACPCGPWYHVYFYHYMWCAFALSCGLRFFGWFYDTVYGSIKTQKHVNNICKQYLVLKKYFIIIFSVINF